MNSSAYNVTKNTPFEVFNPSTGKLIGHAPNMANDELNAAVESAKSAFVSWSSLSDEELQKNCLAVTQAIQDHSDELAKLVTLEQGKPLNGLGSRWEIGGTSLGQTIHRTFLFLLKPYKITKTAKLSYIENLWVLLARLPLGIFR